MTKHYTIKEYESFTRGKSIPGGGYTMLPEQTFDQLEQFVLANRSATDTGALELMSISSRRGIGKLISARNYVGIIAMNDGTGIEILPKIYSARSDDKDATKKIFLEMLKTVKEVPYKTFNVSQLRAEHMNVFEVFIRMFIDEVFTLIKRGLKAAYITHADDEKFFKGRMVFPQHIKHNLVHKERFFVEYDIFSPNRPENRLIKSTIRFLQQKTTSTRNKKDLSMLITSFDGIDYSSNYDSDFSLYIKNRNISEYDTAMRWCKVFLLNKSFSAFSGSEVAYALLFPMEQVFESYVAAKLKHRLDMAKYSIKTQDKRYHLFDFPARKFPMRPDIVITSKENGMITVLDAKWKLLSAAQQNYGISQADMYQMYAYHKKYSAKQVVLVYPMTENVRPIEEGITFESTDGVLVRVAFIDFFDIDKSINNILAIQ